MAIAAIADSFSTEAPEHSSVSVMAFASDPDMQRRISTELMTATNGKANVRDGAMDAALAVAEWPRDLDVLIVEMAVVGDPVADAAALRTATPASCIVIGVGAINDVALYRELIAVGFNDYLSTPLADGAMARAVERAIEARNRGASRAVMLHPTAAKDAKPRTLAVLGARGGVGVTTLAIALAAMLGARLKEEVLLIDLDLHYGSLMLSLDLEAIDALREALDQPDRIDALFIQQVAQKKSEFLYALGAEEAPGGSFQPRPHAANEVLRAFHRRFRWIVADVPHGDPVMQCQVIEAATDVLLVTDLSLPGVRDALRLQQLVVDLAPNAALLLATCGSIDARRSAVKVADVERTLKRKIDCQIPSDIPAAQSAVNTGKPLVESAPRSAIVKSLRPLVARLDGPQGGDEKATPAGGFLAQLGRFARKK